ncbi:sorting nexin-10B-like isoform X2 [Octopus sinensis]|uniref:Sorting nexin-10B-like isoform X2 n=1 Tax=Octopus sinensis TaxID=2607531 RepID=A0A7E6FCY1_9MOLL|nr:sorting nexin-10B-like isoform X2 [Octopus sinensis]
MATYGSLLEEQEKLNSECPEVDRADFLVTNPKTVYKNNRPQYTRYEIITNNASSAFPLRSSRGVYRSFKEFKWLRRILRWEYLTSNIPVLPPNYLFRRNYNPSVVASRLVPLKNFLNECVKDKKIVSDVAFHLFVQSDLTIQDITRQRRGQTHHSYLPCLWNCGGKIHKDDPIPPNQVEYDAI